MDDETRLANLEDEYKKIQQDLYWIGADSDVSSCRPYLCRNGDTRLRNRQKAVQEEIKDIKRRLAWKEEEKSTAEWAE